MAGKKEKPKSSAVARVITNIVIILAVIIFILAVYVIVDNITNPEYTTIFGFKPIIIQSDSMEKTIKTKALVIGQAVPFETIKVNDVITFQMPDGTLNTHRVVEQVEGYNILHTKGDNADAVDSLDITSQNYRYKVVAIMNWVAELDKPEGILLYIVAPVGGLILLIVLMVIMGKHARKKRKKRDAESSVLQEEKTEEPRYFVPGTLPESRVREPFASDSLATSAWRYEPIQDPAEDRRTAQAVLQPAWQNETPSAWRNDFAADITPPSAWRNDSAADITSPPQKPDWRDEIFKEIDLSDIDLNDVSLRYIDLDRLDL